MSVNRVILVGNLGADPELKNTVSGKSVCNLSVATNESFKDAAGARQEKVEWHRVTVWGETAENCGKYLEKGRMVYVEGKIQTRQYEKDGQTRYSTEIVADRVTFIGGGNRREQTNAAADAPRQERRPWGSAQGQGQPQPGNAGDGGDDIPL